MNYPNFKLGDRLYRPVNGETEAITVIKVLREPDEHGPCGQYLFQSDRDGYKGDLSQIAAAHWLEKYGTPPPKVEIIEGLRFYMPQAGSDALHVAVLDHGYHDLGHRKTWVYNCECGYTGDISERQIRDFLEYGTPPPKTEPLPSLDYTEESLISELAEMPIEAECAMHGPGCDFTEFDCEVVEKSHPDAYDYQDVLFEFVRKARELVARRQS